MSEEKRNDNREQSGKREGKKNRRYRGNSRHPKRDYPVCPICGNFVKDINTAIADENSGEPAHFDCIIKKIEQQEQLEKNEKICYLGRGSFGIIKTRNGGSMKFFVRKRIQFEKEEKKYEWRSKISKNLRK